ncbi:MAG: site-2 protease family protein [Candidatus Magasanikbacteria bacterium CG10_big_fil_rev_8_21_14_0_10_43_9]|nr:MAG: site-2 protease family protein [Candidatus Magasanikbacteria bacterium CG10_big_fil_rev_8_21_14_0_10_43_9]PIY92839.1 MAG: site-2 protease family protein [Candidatus Magasanikbacteria bacterium CG_4_10_14_0_8_um_filter_42_12]
MDTIFLIFVIVFSAIIHEYSHGWMANQLGDQTAKYAGRLTLNPLKHIDPIGSILLPLILIPTGFLFAYAKPVPYNPYNLRDQKWGSLKVAIAGPLSNFILAFIFGITLQLVPIGPMTSFLYTIVYANVLLGVFNLVPIPPLDGSKVLFSFLPASALRVRQVLEQYGFLILIVFIMSFSQVLTPIMKFFVDLFVGGGPRF